MRRLPRIASVTSSGPVRLGIRMPGTFKVRRTAEALNPVSSSEGGMRTAWARYVAGQRNATAALKAVPATTASNAWRM
jgi:hypothetical protein